MTNNPRALAVIQRVSPSLNFYEAWLHHRPTIRSKGVGIRSTKDLLQYEANESAQFPTNEIRPMMFKKP
jgi:predicted P-loop ATPase/GTPase